MRKVVLYIGMSLDGYIADDKGGVDWMIGDGSDLLNTGSYLTFLDSIDTIVMGRRTFEQITQELSPNAWPYPEKMTYVLSNRAIKETSEIKHLPEDWTRWLTAMKESAGKDIWICGGAHLAQMFLRQGLIDRLHITLIPCLLGEGLSLFQSIPAQRLSLVETKEYNGMVDVVYEKIN